MKYHFLVKYPFRNFQWRLGDQLKEVTWILSMVLYIVNTQLQLQWSGRPYIQNKHYVTVSGSSLITQSHSVMSKLPLSWKLCCLAVTVYSKQHFQYIGGAGSGHEQIKHSCSCDRKGLKRPCGQHKTLAFKSY